MATAAASGGGGGAGGDGGGGDDWWKSHVEDKFSVERGSEEAKKEQENLKKMKKHRPGLVSQEEGGRNLIQWRLHQKLSAIKKQPASMQVKLHTEAFDWYSAMLKEHKERHKAPSPPQPSPPPPRVRSPNPWHDNANPNCGCHWCSNGGDDE